jgi:hypothetical protein
MKSAPKNNANPQTKRSLEMQATADLDIITATEVPEQRRMAIFPRYFGTRYFQKGENMVYSYMEALATEDYNGGLWRMYELSNGGFYMAPDYDNQFRVSVDNGYQGRMSADAAGIVACMYAFNHLAAISGDEKIIQLCHNLLDFACEHFEARAIRSATD